MRWLLTKTLKYCSAEGWSARYIQSRSAGFGWNLAHKDYFGIRDNFANLPSDSVVPPIVEFVSSALDFIVVCNITNVISTDQEMVGGAFGNHVDAPPVEVVKKFNSSLLLS